MFHSKCFPTAVVLDLTVLLITLRCSVQCSFWPNPPKYFVGSLGSCTLANIPHVEALITLYFSTSGQFGVQMLKKATAENTILLTGS